MNDTITLWRTWAESGQPVVLFLETNDHTVIGSIDLTKWFNYSKPPVLTETGLSEKYYLYIPDLGLGIYFSHYKKALK